MMEIQFGHERFWTTLFSSHYDGLAGIRLHRESSGKTEICAEVVFWDASGHFHIQTFNGDVPVDVIEAMIAEAKRQIPTR